MRSGVIMLRNKSDKSTSRSDREASTSDSHMRLNIGSRSRHDTGVRNMKEIIDLDKLSEEDINKLFDEEDDVFDDDINDDDWVPVEDNGEVSDVEDVSNTAQTIERAEESQSDDDDDISDSVERNQGEVLPVDVIHGRDQTVWHNHPGPQSRTKSHNISRYPGGPLRMTNLYTRLETFTSIFSMDMRYVVIRETNRKANLVYLAYNEAHHNIQPRVWKDITVLELDAFFGILLMAGVHHSNNEHIDELWKPDALSLYKAALSRDRFKQILRFIRFDNALTRQERQETDKAAPIRDLWTMLNSNLLKVYRPHEYLTVDEQLFPYRGRTRFTQYIPSKPAKYGIKVFWVSDSTTYYPLQGTIYTGKPSGGERQTNIGERTVIDLCDRFKKSGRNVTTDNFFTSLELSRFLKSIGITLVGTMRKNKPYIPKQFLPDRDREIFSTRFAFREEAMLCSYVPKKNKAVVLLSSMHSTEEVANTITKKPEIISFYNQTKSGVDVMDKMLTHYSCKRRTSRWPLAFFYNILDIAALAAYVVYSENNPNIRGNDKRRSFLKDLAKDLCTPSVSERSKNKQVIKNVFVKNAIENFFGEAIDMTQQRASHELARDSTGRMTYKGVCYLCQRSKGPSKKKRVTRKCCALCNLPVCDEHIEHLARCIQCVTVQEQ